MSGQPIYLDYQATTPLDARVLEVMMPYLTHAYGNPSSPHALGREAAEAVRLSRAQVRALLGATRDSEIVFTSGATESNHLALLGAAAALGNHGSHVITAAIEHKSVLGACEQLVRCGFTVTRLPVSVDGCVNPAAVERAITPRTLLVSVMHANNEIGTIQPLAEIATITRSRGVLLHTDATQSVAGFEVNVNELGVDLASLSGHKIYGPKGIGALYIRHGVRLVPQLLGGGQEHGLRAGTVNVPSIVGLGHAADLLTRHRREEALRIFVLRERLRHRLAEALPDAWVNGSLTHRLPGNLSITIPGVEAADLLAALPDLALSTGSACATGQPEPSHVLTAIKLTRHNARCTLRISLGRHTNREEVDRAVTRISVEACRLGRARNPLAGISGARPGSR